MKAFREWISERNSKDQVPKDFLDQIFAERSIPLNHWLSCFVVEAQRQDSENYQPATLHNLLAGILCHMREQNPDIHPTFFLRRMGGLKVLMEEWSLPLWNFAKRVLGLK